MPKLADIRTKRANAIEQARAAQQRLESAGKTAEDWSPAEVEEINNLLNGAETLDKEYNELFKLTQTSNRIAELEKSLDEREPNRERNMRPGMHGGGDPNQISWAAQAKHLMRKYQRQGNQLSSPEYDKAFQNYLNGSDMDMQTLKNVRNAAAGMYSDLDEKGGYFITPETWATELIKNVDDETYIQKMSRVIMLPNGTRSLSARCRKAKVSTFQWMGENTDTEDTIDESLRYGKRQLTPHYLKGSVVISRDLLRNVPSSEGMVMEEVAINSAETLEPAYLNGDGNQKPLGLMVASTDGISTARDVTSLATAFDFDDFVRQKYALKTKYRNKASWMLHRYVLQETALLKSGDGQYLWQPSRQIGEPDRILGLPVTETEWMPYVSTSGMYYSLLGDFSHYWIVFELTMQMQRLIELRARTNENEYIFQMKVDAQPVLEEAFVRGKRA